MTHILIIDYSLILEPARRLRPALPEADERSVLQVALCGVGLEPAVHEEHAHGEAE